MALLNGTPLINGTMYDWSSITVNIAGTPVTGITSIEYSDEQEIEDCYGAGRYPVGRGKGRIKCTAKMTLYMQEVVAIQKQSLNGRLQDIAPFDVIVAYLPENGQLVTDVVKNCQFKANKRAWKEGDMKQEVELELVVSHVIWGK